MGIRESEITGRKMSAKERERRERQEDMLEKDKSWTTERQEGDEVKE